MQRATVWYLDQSTREIKTHTYEAELVIVQGQDSNLIVKEIRGEAMYKQSEVSPSDTPAVMLSSPFGHHHDAEEAGMRLPRVTKTVVYSGMSWQHVERTDDRPALEAPE